MGSMGELASSRMSVSCTALLLPIELPQVSNIVEGPAEERVMTTGLHIVRDISCIKCGITLGWKYVSRLQMLA
jgi:hypothetical protein